MRDKGLSELTKEQLILYAIMLEDTCEKQKRELFGLRQTVKNLKEKDVKRYQQSCGEYNYDSQYVNKYHKGE